MVEGIIYFPKNIVMKEKERKRNGDDIFPYSTMYIRHS